MTEKKTSPEASSTHMDDEFNPPYELVKASYPGYTNDMDQCRRCGVVSKKDNLKLNAANKLICSDEEWCTKNKATIKELHATTSKHSDEKQAPVTPPTKPSVEGLGTGSRKGSKRRPRVKRR